MQWMPWFYNMSMNLSNIYILNFKTVDYYCIINWIRRSDPTNLLRDIDLTKTFLKLETVLKL